MTDLLFARHSPGSLDGEGAGDHDAPYRFGRHPRVSAPYPFSTRQYARLLVLRGRVREGLDAKENTNARDALDRHRSNAPLTSFA